MRIWEFLMKWKASERKLTRQNEDMIISFLRLLAVDSVRLYLSAFKKIKFLNYGDGVFPFSIPLKKPGSVYSSNTNTCIPNWFHCCNHMFFLQCRYNIYHMFIDTYILPYINFYIYISQLQYYNNGYSILQCINI